MTEQERKEANRHARIIEILLGAALAVALAFWGWTAIKVMDNGERIAKIETRLDYVEVQLNNVQVRLSNVEARLSNVESRLARIENALNILVARKNGEDEPGETAIE